MFRVNQTKLIELREQGGFKQHEVARTMDIKVGYLNEMEKGRRDLPMKYLVKYSAFLSMRPSELVAILEEKR
jgi:transcriptional regulator with XRE-family HTH domain